MTTPYQAIRRSLALAAAAVAVAGVTAGGYPFAARTTGPGSAVRPPHTSAASFTASPVIVAQDLELSDSQVEQIEADAALALARRASAQRASALIQQHKVAAKASATVLKKARRAAAARTARQQAQVRKAAAARTARQQAQVRKAAAARTARQQAQVRKAAAARAARQQTRRDLVARAQSEPKAVARLLIADHSWGAEQFGCLEKLWTKESGWRWNADNPSSDAYGIPQSLPGSKMVSFGSDWETNPITQIKWGLQYISDSYGTPCSAWAHSRATNWY